MFLSCCFCPHCFDSRAPLSAIEGPVYVIVASVWHPFSANAKVCLCNIGLGAEFGAIAFAQLATLKPDSDPDPALDLDIDTLPLKMS